MGSVIGWQVGGSALDLRKATPQLAAVQPLSGLDVLIVDCQTTGATPAHGAVLEVGWTVVRAQLGLVGPSESHWVTLPSGAFVSPRIRQLTGCQPAEMTPALSPREVWQRLSRALVREEGPVPTAIHFAHFEVGFLRDWANQFAPGAPFPFDVVCTHAIARRLLPELPRRSLRALAGFLGHGLELERRCRGHVEATAFIWQKLTRELEQRGVGNFDELKHWLAAPAPARPARRRYPLAPVAYRSLPDAPGIYRLLRSNGDVLYVGKAASLRKRVASHFTAGANTSERALEMLTQVSEIQTTETATALEAALLENDEIKRREPTYNVQLMEGAVWFFDRALETAVHDADRQHPHGPFPTNIPIHALGAIRALLGGATPSDALRARAVGAPLPWAPDRDTFAAGQRLFFERHGLASRSPRPNAERLKDAARRLLAAASQRTPSEAPADTETSAVSQPGEWDAERVLRHLERGITHAHQLLQRARWLCLLHDSVVVFREPSSDRMRRLSITAGCIGPAEDAGELQAARVLYRPRHEVKAAFDRRRYDCLRTLTSELRRILRDGGSVQIGVGRGHWLHGEALRAALRWI